MLLNDFYLKTRKKLTWSVEFCWNHVALILVQNEKQLSALPELDCAVCAADIKTYYDRSLAIKLVSQKMLEIAVENRQGHSIVSRGRVVILFDEARNLVFDICHVYAVFVSNSLQTPLGFWLTVSKTRFGMWPVFQRK